MDKQTAERIKSWMTWIPVDESLPAMREIYQGSPLESESVLIFNGYYVTIGQYKETYQKRIARWESMGRLSRVTHWMPLPEGPLVEEKGDA